MVARSVSALSLHTLVLSGEFAFFVSLPSVLVRVMVDVLVPCDGTFGLSLRGAVPLQTVHPFLSHCASQIGLASKKL